MSVAKLWPIVPLRDIYHRLFGSHEQNIHYDTDPALGFPGTPPHPVTKDVFTLFSSYHANNIGLHTSNNEAEHGFAGTQKLEREVLDLMAKLLGGSLNTTDGYITSGGTEGNIMGLWLGRGESTIKPKPTSLFITPFTHYSFVKAANLLGIPSTPQNDGSGTHLVGTDANGRMDVNYLVEAVTSSISLGAKSIIIGATAGTTMLGSVDPINHISDAIGHLKDSFQSINFHLHVDACYGGMIAPFLDHLPQIGFTNPHVDSVIVDWHKTGLMPYGMGAFLTRKGLFERVKTDSIYFPGGDATLLGSRPGINAALAWATLYSLGSQGFADLAKELMAKTDALREILLQAGFCLFESDLPIIGVKGTIQKNLAAKYRLHTHNNLPWNFSKPHGQLGQSLWNIVVMPHTKTEHVEALTIEFKKDKPSINVNVWVEPFTHEPDGVYCDLSTCMPESTPWTVLQGYSFVPYSNNSLSHLSLRF